MLQVLKQHNTKVEELYCNDILHWETELLVLLASTFSKSIHSLTNHILNLVFGHRIRRSIIDRSMTWTWSLITTLGAYFCLQHLCFIQIRNTSSSSNEFGETYEVGIENQIILCSFHMCNFMYFFFLLVSYFIIMFIHVLIIIIQLFCMPHWSKSHN